METRYMKVIKAVLLWLEQERRPGTPPHTHTSTLTQAGPWRCVRHPPSTGSHGALGNTVRQDWPTGLGTNS